MPDVILFFPKPKTIASFLPYSLLYLASYLRKEGIESVIIDQTAQKDWKKQLKKHLDNNPVCVGFSTRTGKQIHHNIEVSKWIKKHSDVPVIWGGLHPTFFPEQTLNNPFIDYIITGEGEHSFTELVSALKSGSSCENINGVGYKRDNRIFINPQDELLDLSLSPDIPFDLLDFSIYNHNMEFGKTLSYITSKGCPHKCRFCYNMNINKCKWRPFPLEKVINDIVNLRQRVSFDYILFLDDNFFVKPKRVLDIFYQLKEKNISLNWFCECRVDYIKRFPEEYLKEIKALGCNQLFIGAESGSNKILKDVNKNITTDDILEVNIKLRDVGIEPLYSFILGSPNETYDDLQKTISLILQIFKDNPRANIYQLNVYNPYPGTDMFDELVKNGYNPPQSLEGWSDFSFSNLKEMKWIGPDLIKYYKTISITSRFFKSESAYNVLPFFIKYPARVCFNIARWRWEKNRLNPSLDTFIYNMVFNTINRLTGIY